MGSDDSEDRAAKSSIRYPAADEALDRGLQDAQIDRVRHVRHGYDDDVGAAHDQRARDQVRPIAEGFRGVVYAFPRVVGDARAGRERAGYGGLRHACQPRGVMGGGRRQIGSSAAGASSVVSFIPTRRLIALVPRG